MSEFGLIAVRKVAELTVAAEMARELMGAKVRPSCSMPCRVCWRYRWNCWLGLILRGLCLAPTPPTLGASATEIVRYTTEHHNATLIAAFLFATTATLFTIWAGVLAARLRDAEREGAWLYLAFLAGVIVTLSVNVSASFIWMALSGRGWTAGDATAQTLSDIINYGYIFTGFGSVPFVGAASIVMIRTGEIARTLGQLGLLVAAIQVVYLFTAFFNDGLMVGGGVITIAGFTLLGLWLLAVSIAMIVRDPVITKMR